MKKIFTILSIALAAAVACNKQSFVPDIHVADNAPAEGSKVLLRLSLGDEAAATRGSMTHQPTITPDSTMYVLVFNANSGMLIEVAKAKFEAGGSVTENTGWDASSEEALKNIDFEAIVSTGSAPRYLHVIVDPPTHEHDGSSYTETDLGYKKNPVYIGESEANVFAKLYNSEKKTSYWQRVSLPNGITAYTYPGGKPLGVQGTDWTSWDKHDDDPTQDTYIDGENNTVYYGDYVNGVGHKITDGVGYIASDEVAALLRHIPTIRNFVNIQVSKADNGNFVPLKAVLLNTPAHGFVAPYSSASGFVSYYVFKENLQYLKPVLNPEQGKLYGTEGVASTGYTAPVPKDSIVVDCPLEAECVYAENGVIDLYMYERGVPTSKPTQLLVYGNLDGEATWLKIDITDEDGNYVPFYREFTYPMRIGAITGTKGYGTMKGAFDGPSIGNPSSSPETATLTQVIDGKGVGIWVDFIDYASFEKGGETVSLRYKFWGPSGPLTDSANLEVTHTTGTGAITTTTLTGSEYTGSKPTQDGAGGWYVVDVPLQPQGSTTYKSTLRVSGTTTNSANKTVTLYRDVTFSVMPTQTFTDIKMSKLEADAIDQPTTATVTLPDGLGYSLFPLVIRIEAYNGSINPDGADLPVAYGESTFSTLKDDADYGDLYRDTNFYWFNMTIDYRDYAAGKRVFEADFKTIIDMNQAGATNQTTVLFTDAKGHFYPKPVALSI